MFEYDIGTPKHFTSKVDGERAYKNFCLQCGIAESKYPFTLKTEQTFKVSSVTFKVTSWGSYINASGQWVVFIAYYAAGPRHTSQYSWSIDEYGKVLGEPRQYGFIN